MTNLKPLDIVLIKHDNNKYRIELKWFRTEAYDSPEKPKREVYSTLYSAILDFFPEYSLAGGNEELWNYYNPDIPYKIGYKYLKPYADIIYSKDWESWSGKTIPLNIYYGKNELQEIGASMWHPDDFYWESIRKKFGEEETIDWDFDNREEMITFMKEQNIPLPDKALVDRTRLEWLKIKNVLS